MTCQMSIRMQNVEMLISRYIIGHYDKCWSFSTVAQAQKPANRCAGVARQLSLRLRIMATLIKGTTPDTVPQASIDMTTVLEVSEADSVTGHSYSLAITAPERVTFVKGTCREEARWWSDVLSVYPRSKVSIQWKEDVVIRHHRYTEGHIVILWLPYVDSAMIEVDLLNN
ncbi:hypothetical protein HW555_002053 [Spodoptera exigua]|uniref:Uncharacterized protein n=1 Tax=Spodoptera exigua TaxID=7107 RepID=A0A835GP72_SPOEX|nr:hypothetical protein HW555_002053 [Spodoptera exigua]